MEERNGNMPDIPPIPRGLIDAALRGKLVLFIGAGVTMVAGGASWDQFATNLFDQLVSQGALRFRTIEQLKELGAKKKISIAMNIFEQNGLVPELETALNLGELTDHEIHKILYSLGTPIVTTNYDGCLDEMSEKAYPGPDTSLRDGEFADENAYSREFGPRAYDKVIYQKEQLTVEKIDVPGNILHLHGSIKTPDTMILTTKQYLDHYYDELITTFLEKLFEDHTVLFIGYSLDEQELLEQIFRASKSTREMRHYLLFPCFSHQNDLFDQLRTYYLQTHGVELVCYCIDDGYDQITDVMKAWSQEILGVIREPGFIERSRIIDEALDE